MPSQCISRMVPGQFGFELDIGVGGEGFHVVLVRDVERGEAGVGDAEATCEKVGGGVAGDGLDGLGDGSGVGIEEENFGDAPVVVDAGEWGRRGR